MCQAHFRGENRIFHCIIHSLNDVVCLDSGDLDKMYRYSATEKCEVFLSEIRIEGILHKLSYYSWSPQHLNRSIVLERENIEEQVIDAFSIILI